MLNMIESIKMASGNDKIEVLKRCSALKNILVYAYDPFKKYHMTAPDMDGIENGHKMNADTKDLLDDLVSRDLSGQAAFEAVCDHLSTMEKDDAKVFRMILNKDLRCGINVKTINKAFPDLIPLTWDGSKKPDIMLLKTFKASKCTWPMLAAVKKDGVRARFVGGQLISRQGHKFLSCEHIEKELAEFGQELDGELCIPDMIFDDASGKIRGHTPCPEIEYHVFDIPSLGGTKNERYMWLYENLIQSDKIKLIIHFGAHNIGELMGIYEDAVELGEEGIVVYDPDSLYEDKRSYDWMRLVPLKTADCRVIDFFEGNGKLAGSLGGIVVDYNGYNVKVGTGFKEKVLKNQVLKSGEESRAIFYNPNLSGTKYRDININKENIRDYIWANRRKFYGAIAEVEFKEKTKSGSMRQPRFKGWRWDKM